MRSFLVSCVLCVLAGACLPVSAVVAALANHVVISEIAINVGGAANEFIELYNPTEYAIDLSTLDLKLHVVNSSGVTDTNKTLTWINTLIPAGGYFLIASTGYVAATTIAADATYSASSGGLVSDGAVYISTSAAAGVNILDALDYGADTSDVGEGSSAVDIPNDQSLERKATESSTGETLGAGGNDATNGNGEDSDDNVSDFVLRTTPEPQTSISAVEILLSGGSSDLSSTPVDTTAPKTTASPAGGVFHAEQTVVLTTDESATMYYTTDGSAPTMSSTIYAHSITVTTTTTLSFFAVDPAGNIENIRTETYVIASPVAATSDVIINEIAWAGSSISSADEWLELYNTTSNTTYDLTHWQLSGAAASGGDLVLASGILPPGGYFLIANNTADHVFTVGESTLAVAPDIVDTSVSLSNSTLQITLKDSLGTTIDTAGDGGAPFFGHTSMPASMARTSAMDGALGTSWATSVRATNLDSNQPDCGTPHAPNFLTVDASISNLVANRAMPLPGESLILTATIANIGVADMHDAVVEFFDGDPAMGGVFISTHTISMPAFGTADVTTMFTPMMGAHTISARVMLVGDEDVTNNSATTSVTVSNHVVISEFLPNPIGHDETGEWIEFLNPTDAVVDLTGFTISNGSTTAILAGSIDTGAYAFAFINDAVGALASSLAFTGSWPTLANSSGTLAFRNASGEIIDAYDYTSGVEGASFARSDVDALTWTTLRHPTRGVANLEINQPPIAMIATQSASACSLSINLDGTSSYDADGDMLTYAWDFGDGTMSSAANPGYHTYVTAGTYLVRLVVTDTLGATASAMQSFSVAICSGSRSARVSTPTKPEMIASIPASRVRILLSTIAFNSKTDFIELFVADDGAGGSGVDLGGFYFDDGKRCKTIPRGFVIKTGEYFTLTFDASTSDDVTSRQLFATHAGLVKTDVALTFRDATRTIVDAALWANHDGTWTRSRADDVADVVQRGEWVDSDESSAIDSRLAHARETVVKRKTRVSPHDYIDTNTAADWEIVAATDRPYPLSQKSRDIFLSEILSRPLGGDARRDEWVELINRGSIPVELFGWRISTGTSSYTFQHSFLLAPGEFHAITDAVSLRNDGGRVSLYDFEHTQIDDVVFPKMLAGESYARMDDDWHVTDVPTRNAANIAFTLPDFSKDMDGDGALDADERQRGLNPKKFDTDGDQLPDGFELVHGLDPHHFNTPTTELLAARTRELNTLLLARLATSTDVQSGFTLAGVGIPGGIVHVTMHSEPQTADVPVGADGVWRYILDVPLSVGDHEVFTALADPTGLVSDGQKVLALTLPHGFTPPTFANNVRFSEILARPRVATDGEWIELENVGNTSVDVSNWILKIGTREIVIAPGTTLAPHGFAVIRDARLRLADAGGHIALHWPNGKSIDAVTWPRMQANVSFAAMQDTTCHAHHCADRTWVRTATPTPNAPNRFVAIPLHGRQQTTYADGDHSTSIVISELVANPIGRDTVVGEWIELRNMGTDRVRLGNWQLVVGKKTFTFSNATILAAGEYRVFRRSETKLALKNTGATSVQLVDPDGRMISRMMYVDTAEGVAFARDIDGVFRATSRVTPAAENQFDTQKIVGVVRHIGDDGVLLDTRDGEVWVYFDARGASLVARATFVVGEHATIFAHEAAHTFVLVDFALDAATYRFSPRASHATTVPVAFALAIGCISTFIAYGRRRKLAEITSTVWNSH